MAPEELLSVTCALREPLTSMAIEGDEADALFAALERQFGPIHLLAQKECGPDSHQKWVGLLRWMLEGFRTWTSREDPARRQLIALLVVTAACDQQGDLWGRMPLEIGENAELVATLEGFVRQLQIEYSPRVKATPPIWERETIEGLRAAEEAMDWEAISDLWPVTERMFVPNVFLEQIVRTLHRYATPRLVRACESDMKFAVARLVAGSLNVVDRLGLAAESANPSLQFACIFETVSEMPRSSRLTKEAEDRAVRLLLRVSHDQTAWTKWMGALNRYPSRYPCLQAALGRALASVSRGAVDAYVDSVQLSTTSGTGREAVANCLRVFREHARSDHAHALWRRAYERWKRWDFDASRNDVGLFDVAATELDYAVVGFAVECMNATERGAAQDEILDRMNTLDTEWHESLTACVATWNRLMSRLQPYTHATHGVPIGKDWVASNSYRPELASATKYVELMYRIR